MSQTKITDLNDDCLIKICQQLVDKHDLYNLKRSNKIFGKAIDYVVAKSEFKFVVFDKEENIKEDGKIIGGFLYFFGDKMKCLNMFSQNGIWQVKNEQLEAIIQKYCTGGNIKRCHFIGFDIESFFERNTSFFNALESLNINLPYDVECVPNNSWLFDFIATSVNLKEFQFHSGKSEDKCDIFRAIVTSKLEIFGLSFYWGTKLITKIDDMPINYTLKVLDLGFNCCDPVILTHFPNIEQIMGFGHLDGYSLDPILTLPALKILGLQCDVKDPIFLTFFEKLAEKNQLEVLHLHQMAFRGILSAQQEAQVTENLCKMTNLKKLVLGPRLNLHEDLPQIGQCLTKLERFSFVDDDEYYSYINLLGFVKAARNLSFLWCEYVDYFDPEELMKIRKEQQNTKTLCIRNDYYFNNCTLTDEQKQYIKLIGRKD